MQVIYHHSSNIFSPVIPSFPFIPESTEAVAKNPCTEFEITIGI